MSKKISNLQRQTDELIKQIKSTTGVPFRESPDEKKKRIERMLSNWQEFLKYYFPNLAKSPFAAFHLRGGDAVLKFKRKKTIFAWMCSRALSKTTFWQMYAIYLNCRAIHNMPHGYKTCLWWSKTNDQAVDAMRLIRLQFEYNDRLINDFGRFRTETSLWTEDRFVTTQGITWKALGKGQSPRGTKDDDAIRPDLIIGDDFDDDAEVLNAQRLEKTWHWAMKALWPTMDISTAALFVVLNNKIAEDSLMTRFWEIADYKEQVNLLDHNGRPTWPERHELADCQFMIEKMGSVLSRAEYFNEPVTEGKIFKKDWIAYKDMEDLAQFTALVAYLDPGFSSGKNADHKAWVLLGAKSEQWHVIKTYCAATSIEEMVQWGYEMERYIKAHRGAAQFYMEEVFFQNILYRDFNAAAKKKGWPLPIQGDTRDKPNKDQRIMKLSGYFERGDWYFNAAEKDNPHMKALVTQFTAFQPGHTGIKKDGPDACEGALEKIIEKIVTNAPPKVGTRPRNKNMY